jgi:phosphate starvation-inducible protein PhoH
MRGRTFKNSFIIADEMQNSSPNQMFMLTTRMGEKTKMVITGDLKQSDKGGENGLIDFMNKYAIYPEKDSSGIKVIKMTGDDVERSEIVKTILDIYSPKPIPKIPPRLYLNETKSSRQAVGLSDAALIPLSEVKRISK